LHPTVLNGIIILQGKNNKAHVESACPAGANFCGVKAKVWGYQLFGGSSTTEKRNTICNINNILV